jgi:hypothetical protein
MTATATITTQMLRLAMLLLCVVRFASYSTCSVLYVFYIPISPSTATAAFRKSKERQFEVRTTVKQGHLTLTWHYTTTLTLNTEGGSAAEGGRGGRQLGEGGGGASSAISYEASVCVLHVRWLQCTSLTFTFTYFFLRLSKLNGKWCVVFSSIHKHKPLVLLPFAC